MYENNIIPFGLANAPGIFKELISVVLHNMKDFALAYLNDMILFPSYSRKSIEHIHHVFNSLRNHELKLNVGNCVNFYSNNHSI